MLRSAIALLAMLAQLLATSAHATERIEEPPTLKPNDWRVLITPATEQLQARIAIWKFDAEFHVTLEIVCREGAPAVRLSTNAILASYQPHEVIYRFDEGEPVASLWDQDIGMPPVTTTLLAPAAQQRALLDGISRAARLTLETLTAAGPLSGSFDLAAGRDAVTFMHENCFKTGAGDRTVPIEPA